MNCGAKTLSLSKGGLKFTPRNVQEPSWCEWEYIHRLLGSVLHSRVRSGWCWLWSRSSFAHARFWATVYYKVGGSLDNLS